jgi:hypothetical protein
MLLLQPLPQLRRQQLSEPAASAAEVHGGARLERVVRLLADVRKDLLG